MRMEGGKRNQLSHLTGETSHDGVQRVPLRTGQPSFVRSLTAVSHKVPKIGMKATELCELQVQLRTVIEPCSTQAPAPPPTGTRRHLSNSGKSDLDSIRAFRQKNLVQTRKGPCFSYVGSGTGRA